MNYLSKAPLLCLFFCTALSGVAEAAITPISQSHSARVRRFPVGGQSVQTVVSGQNFVDFDDSVVVFGDGGPDDLVTATSGIAMGFGLNENLISISGSSVGGLVGTTGDTTQTPLYRASSSSGVEFSTDHEVEISLSYTYWNLGSASGLVSSAVSLSDITDNPDGDYLHFTRRDNETEAYSYSDMLTIVVGPGDYHFGTSFRALGIQNGDAGVDFEIATGYSYEFTVRTVPAPSGLALMGVGGMLIGRRRRGCVC